MIERCVDIDSLSEIRDGLAKFCGIQNNPDRIEELPRLDEWMKTYNITKKTWFIFEKDEQELFGIIADFEKILTGEKFVSRNTTLKHIID